METTIDKNQKHEILINSSSFRYATCQRAYNYYVLDEIQSTAETKMFKAAYGTAFHAMLAELYSGNPDMKAVIKQQLDYYEPFTNQLGDKDWHTLNHLQSTMISYIKNYKNNDVILPLSVDGKPLIEQKIKIPFYETDRTRVSLYGTVDLVGEYLGRVCIIDHKVTSSRDQKEFLNKYRFNIQPMFYSYLLSRLTGKDYLPVVINGIFIKQGTKAAGYADNVIFQRSDIIEYSIEQMNEFIEYLTVFVSDLVAKFELNLIDNELPNYAACNAGFSPCPYLPLCEQSKENQAIIKSCKFVKRDNNLAFKFAE